jgi:hypothetical protein
VRDALIHSDHSLGKIRQQRLFRFVLIRFEHPVMSTSQVREHRILSLPNQENWLNRDNCAGSLLCA